MVGEQGTQPRVAQVITRMVPGGAARIVRSLVEGLGKDYRIDLITGPEELPAGLATELVGPEELRILPGLGRAIRPWDDLRTVVGLYRLLQEQDYDLVHSHTSKAGLLARTVRRMGVEVPVVHSPHGLIYGQEDHIPGLSSGILSGALLLAEQWAGRSQAAFTCLSNHSARQAHQLGLASSDQLRVVPNGIDPNEFQPTEDRRRQARDRWGLDEEETMVLTVGRLAAEKGQDVLLEAMARLEDRHPELRLLVAGTGNRKGLLERSASVPENLRFVGYVEEVASLYWAADLYVHPARYEGFGLAVLEAMAAGCPVVASRVGGIPELLGEAGVMVPPDRVERLSDAIEKILANKDRQRHLSRQAQDRAREFDLDRMLDRYDRIYRETLGTGR